MSLLDWFKVPASLGNIDDAQLAAQHVQLQKQIARLRLVLTLSVLGLLLVFVLAAKARVDAIPGDEVANALEKRADVIATQLGNAASEVLDEVGPPVGEAVGKEAAAALDDMQKKLDSEMEDLEKSTTQTFRTAYAREIKAASDDGAKLLQDNFPALKGDPKKVDALLAAFQDSVQQWAQKQLVTTFKKHIDTMFRIKITLNRLVREGPPKGALGAPEDTTGVSASTGKIQPERLLEMWIELVNDALGGTEDEGELLAETPAEKAKEAKEAKANIEFAPVKKAGEPAEKADDAKAPAAK